MTDTVKKSNRVKNTSGTPNPVDIHVGNRIRMRRNVLGWSQEKLAMLMGLTFQQVQKYEKGFNRVSASRLWDFSKVLNSPLSFFFEDMEPEVANQSPRMVKGGDAVHLNDGANEFNQDPMLKKETLEMVSAYYKINNKESARLLFELILSMSKTQYMHGRDDEEKE